MELPICNGTYTNESDVLDIDFLDDIFKFTIEYIQKDWAFFVGLCYGCEDYERSLAQPLQRCGGCQLVAYCSRDCQKHDRIIHKYACKEFPVVNGKNALYTTRPWKEHIAGLRKQAARITYADIAPVYLPIAERASKRIFQNPRVCHNCMESRPDRLTDCKCLCVSYCSRRCAKADKQHKKDCTVLSHIAEEYSYSKEFSSRRSKNYFATEPLSYPKTLMYALQSLPGHRLGRNQAPLEDLTTLDVHVVTSSPLFASGPWEVCVMHALPKLKQLNVVFVIQGKELMSSFRHNFINMNLLRSQECKVNNRVITYSVKQMQYHMFFSSPEYSTPDAVVVYGNAHEMSASDEGDINSDISYRNMTYSRDTVLVLTDVSTDLVRQGVRAVNATRPVEQLVSPQTNPCSGISSNRAALDSDVAIINEKSYFTCLRRK